MILTSRLSQAVDCSKFNPKTHLQSTGTFSLSSAFDFSSNLQKCANMINKKCLRIPFHIHYRSGMVHFIENSPKSLYPADY